MWNGVTNAKYQVNLRALCLVQNSLFSGLLFSLHSTDVSFAMDTKCIIKSSCSLSGCHQPDPMTVNPASNITLNCTIITGGLARDMTWNQTVQALERVKNGSSTGLSNLVLEQSNSTKSGEKYSCQCTTIKLARECFLIQPWYQLKTIKIIFFSPKFVPSAFPLRLSKGTWHCKSDTVADSGFFKGGGWEWYLRVVESMGHASKMLQFENWSLTENLWLWSLQSTNNNKIHI